MTYFKLKIFQFAFSFIYAMILFKIIDILMWGRSFWSFEIFGNLILPFVVVFTFLVLVGHFGEQSYYLKSGQSKEVIQKLYSLGYLPTADPGPVFFFKKRRLNGWKTARIEEGEKYLILRIMEKVEAFENDLKIEL